MGGAHLRRSGFKAKRHLFEMPRPLMAARSSSNFYPPDMAIKVESRILREDDYLTGKKTSLCELGDPRIPERPPDSEPLILPHEVERPNLAGAAGVAVARRPRADKADQPRLSRVLGDRNKSPRRAPGGSREPLSPTLPKTIGGQLRIDHLIGEKPAIGFVPARAMNLGDPRRILRLGRANFVCGSAHCPDSTDLPSMRSGAFATV